MDKHASLDRKQSVNRACGCVLFENNSKVIWGCVVCENNSKVIWGCADRTVSANSRRVVSFACLSGRGYRSPGERSVRGGGMGIFNMAKCESDIRERHNSSNHT